MTKRNCWEVKGCRKEECPAHFETRLNGIHGGINAGRACWVVAGTRCGGVVSGDFAKKEGDCMKCEVYQMVKVEEGASGLKNGLVLLDMIK